MKWISMCINFTCIFLVFTILVFFLFLPFYGLSANNNYFNDTNNLNNINFQLSINFNSTSKDNELKNKSNNSFISKEFSKKELLLKTSSNNYTNLEIFKNYTIIADNNICAKIGSSVLGAGGSAADAVISTSLCESVVAPHLSGLGGSVSILVYSLQGEIFSLEASSKIPKNFIVEQKNFKGINIAVPGAAFGLWELHQKFGRIPWPELVRPAAEICRRGHPVTPGLADALQNFQSLASDSTFKEVFWNPWTNTVLKEGERLKQSQLAQTLDFFGSYGPRIFYNNFDNNKYLTELAQSESSIDLNDFRNYSPQWKPIHLISLYGDSNKKWILATNNDNEISFWWNTTKENSNSIKQNNQNFHKNLKIKMNKIQNATSIINVISPQGEGIVLSSSLGTIFGSGIISKSLGFLWNNQLKFLKNSSYEYINANNEFVFKGFIFSKERKGIVLSFGAYGIIPEKAVSHMLVRFLLQGENLKNAIVKPRIELNETTNNIYKESIDEKGNLFPTTDLLNFTQIIAIAIIPSNKKMTEMHAYFDSRKSYGSVQGN